MCQQLHNLKFPELLARGWGGRKSGAGLGPVQTSFSVDANGGITCTSVCVKGVRGFRGPPLKVGLGLTEASCQIS